jgi:hypothetical protein
MEPLLFNFSGPSNQKNIPHPVFCQKPINLQSVVNSKVEKKLILPNSKKKIFQITEIVLLFAQNPTTKRDEKKIKCISGKSFSLSFLFSFSFILHFLL